jgi:hypothetical protein
MQQLGLLLHQRLRTHQKPEPILVSHRCVWLMAVGG